MRGEVGLGQRAERVILGEGLLDEDVEAATAALARGERVREGGFDDDAPRAQFTILTPFFILANAAALTMPSVCSVRGMCTVM